jgi:predicted RND superfamily exporter protein
VNFRDPAGEKIPVLNEVNSFVDSQISLAPFGLKSLRQVCRSFLFIPTEQAFFYSAVSGMAIALSFCYIVLLIATGNIITSTLSIICVTIVIGSVITIMVLKGWSLGVSESISIVVIIGFSVDYTVHLASDYMHSPHSSRSDKMR